MASVGNVVVLNGPPRSGKTSLTRAIQERFEGAWMNLGVDAFKAATPDRYQPGIGLRPGGERPDLEPIVRELYLAMYDSVAAHARRGLNVVVDVGHHDAYSRPLGILAAVAPLLVELEALFVGIHCPTEVVMQRRDGTGWTREPPFLAESGVPEAVARWQGAVHDPGLYDLEIDTSRLTETQAAQAVGARMNGKPPSAVRRLVAASAEPSR